MDEAYTGIRAGINRCDSAESHAGCMCFKPHAAEVATDTMPSKSTVTQNQAAISAPQHTPVAAAATGKPDGFEGKGSAEGGSSSCNADNACPLKLITQALAAANAAVMPGTTAVGISSAVFGGVAVSSGSKPAASLKSQLLPLSILHTQPIACISHAASLQDSPRPDLQQPPCIHHPSGAAAPKLGTPCWANGGPWPDSPRQAPQPSLPLPRSVQDAALLTRPAMGLASAPDYMTLPDSPRPMASLPQSMHAVFQTTTAGSTPLWMHGLQLELLTGSWGRAAQQAGCQCSSPFCCSEPAN